MARRPAGNPPRPQVLAFLDAIKERPEDDVPRLILADWLEEHGDPRGEFVRLQVQRARLPEYSREWSALRRREEAIRKRHAAEWKRPLRSVGGRWSYERGLASVCLPRARL